MKINTIDRAAVEPIDTLPMFTPVYRRALGAITAEAAENDSAPLDFDIQRPVRLAMITCAVCGVAARIPFLADGKLCDLCRADLVMAESNVRADLGLVQDVRDACWEDWVELHGAATPEDQDRYSVASEARKTGMVRGKPVAPATIEKLWADATQKGDGLSTLLEQHDICIAADRGLTQARHRAELALREIEAAR